MKVRCLKLAQDRDQGVLFSALSVPNIQLLLPGHYSIIMNEQFTLAQSHGSNNLKQTRSHESFLALEFNLF